ncbi:ACP S-malonyltransferase [Rhodospirillaceae bacterium KN72]|uniref:[acyl-carrier-protein] S-malonyltransferase n=1 Tax=Pacificispira spongiicola TaxID=2729598 RepID=A0A7Y0DXI1_9PROT|nr:ACP S-malonyltransferase [Pacificispira spongiicola]NMM43263.1 ACP S-malonyltransferase [Pacificispira spongiicola]
MSKQRALIVCPGRGTYNKDELGYLARYHGAQAKFIADLDAARSALGQTPVSALDGAARYSVADHTRGDNASPLIYACAYSDFLTIDRNRIEPVAVTGNSMGWYIALACAGALDAMGGFTVVNTMGTLMQEALIGGQLIYPFVDENWRDIPGKKADILSLTEEIDGLYLSIDLGGMLVLAGTDNALAAAEKRLPVVQERFPMRLANHAAFHTPLQQPVAERGQAALPLALFHSPDLPLIDGRGHVWFPKATDSAALRDYTLGHQVVEPYDFTAAVRSGLREFAPDLVIVLGPGQTLGGAVAQTMIANSWRGQTCKDDFTALQKAAPYLVSLGMDGQRGLAIQA